MNVQLKQSEIVEALKQYIAKQGINLSGKEVTITFTAGRKESGITADLVIEDAGIPGFTDAELEDSTEDGGNKASKSIGLKVIDGKPDLEAAPESPEVEAASDPEPEVDVPVAKTTSLFS